MDESGTTLIKLMRLLTEDAELVERMEFAQLAPHLEEMQVTIADVIESQKKSFTWRAGMA